MCVGEKEHFNVNLEDEVVRGSIVLQNGQWLWPPPQPVGPPPQAAAQPAAEQKAAVVVPEAKDRPFMATLKTTGTATAGMHVVFNYKLKKYNNFSRSRYWNNISLGSYSTKSCIYINVVDIRFIWFGWIPHCLGSNTRTAFPLDVRHKCYIGNHSRRWFSPHERWILPNKHCRSTN